MIGTAQAHQLSGTVSVQAAASNTGQTVTIRTNSDIEANRTN
jgi:hypothetical protein